MIRGYCNNKLINQTFILREFVNLNAGLTRQLFQFQNSSKYLENKIYIK